MNDSTTPAGRARLPLHLAAWLVFSIVAVALRGVRWDETLEWAQVLLGDIVYPEYHPINRFIWSAYTVQHYVTAGILALVEDPFLVNGYRNVLVLIFGISAVFLWSARLTGRLFWAHAATALALFNVLTPFETTYPFRIWPYCFSDGPVGLGWALVTLYLVLNRHWRFGALMLSIMPTIHLGQMPAVFVTSFLFTVVQWRSGSSAEIRRALPFAATGFAVCIGLAVTIFLNRVPAPASGPYFATGDAMRIWSNYKEIWYHTSIRGGLQDFLHSHITGAMSLLLSAPFAWQAIRSRRFGDLWLWLFVFTAITTGAVWTAMWLHAVLGENIPFIVIGWMPYRLANHLPVLVLAISLGILVTDNRGRTAGTALLVAGLAGSIVSPLLSQWTDPALVERYLSDGSWILYLLVGAATASLARGCTPDGTVPNAWGALVLAAGAVLLTLHQFAFVSLLVGGILFHMIGWLTFVPEKHSTRVLVTVTLVSLAIIGFREYESREHPPAKGFDVRMEITEFDRAVRAYFAELDIDDEIVIADNFAAFMQARIDQPVMANWMLGSYIIYTPEFGPPIQKLFYDIYGIKFGESVNGRRPQQPDVWQPLWSERTAAEWRALGEEYNVHWLIAPTHLNVNLPAVVEKDGFALHRIGDD